MALFFVRNDVYDLPVDAVIEFQRPEHPRFLSEFTSYLSRFQIFAKFIRAAGMKIRFEKSVEGKTLIRVSEPVYD